MRREVLIRTAHRSCSSAERSPEMNVFGTECFINGADWIVNANWHNMKEFPKDGRMLLLYSPDKGAVICGPNSTEFKTTSAELGTTMWSYIEDLLPTKSRKIQLGIISKDGYQSDELPWVSVEEKLPELEERVLVRTNNGKYAVCYMILPTDCHGVILGRKEWTGSSAFASSITHWMRIPN